MVMAFSRLVGMPALMLAELFAMNTGKQTRKIAPRPLSLVEKQGSKIRHMFSREIPLPVSATLQSTYSPTER